MNFGYLVVEGPHDVELIARLLRPRGFKRVQLKARLDSYLHPLIPTRYPGEDGDLLRRVEVPVFLASAAHTIAVRSAGGDQRLVRGLKALLPLEGWEERIGGIGVILDADAQRPQARFASFHKALIADRDAPALTLPEGPGQIAAGPPRCGAFVLPDNASSGTLEDLVLEAAALSYSKLHAAAGAYIEQIGQEPIFSSLTTEDLREFHLPSGKKKATLSAMASVLRPGKAIQTSLQDNRWLDGASLDLPRLQEIQRFLCHLFSL